MKLIIRTKAVGIKTLVKCFKFSIKSETDDKLMENTNIILNINVTFTTPFKPPPTHNSRKNIGFTKVHKLPVL